MCDEPSGSKRQADASESDVPAKRSSGFLASEEVEAVLRTIASSINVSTLALMNLPCADVAARGRVVDALAESERQLNNILGIKSRVASVLAISDLIIGVFLFVGRKELDTLQIVSRRFDAIVVNKMARVSLRLLKSAKMERSKAENQFVLIMDEFGVKKKTRLLTRTEDEAAATKLLLNACQSSRLDILQLSGTTPMNVDFFDALERCAPSIFLKDFCLGNRTLSDVVRYDKVLQVLQKFAELTTIDTTGKDLNLQNCLIRTCFKVGVTVHRLVLDKKCDTTIVENALLEFCFGACDAPYAMRERFLEVEFTGSPKSDFLQRWIEKVEVSNCRHKLTLHIGISQTEVLPQDTTALAAYKQNSQNDRELRFGSVSGRKWAATYSTRDTLLTFNINY
ncbi:hypothetical protein AAVH_13442 [Aphelenchoides avenae]|nr:hypothetical protein AAVH_13442 [Aphelenchus avenae]